MRHGSPRLDRVRGRFRNRLSEQKHHTTELQPNEGPECRLVDAAYFIRTLRALGMLPATRFDRNRWRGPFRSRSCVAGISTPNSERAYRPPLLVEEATCRRSMTVPAPAYK
jgi:hypothetical protein